jgi:hypothetical protein
MGRISVKDFIQKAEEKGLVWGARVDAMQIHFNVTLK